MTKLEVIKEALSHVNAQEIKAYDTDITSPFFTHVVIASVDSIRQLNAALEYLKDGFAENNYHVKSAEGKDSGWVLVDGDDILVHVFSKDERERFDLDKLYIDVPEVTL